MLTEKISAQNFAVKVLSSHIRSHRVSHTYLFTGEIGSGKKDLALAFAAALNCETKNYFETCTCNPCHKLENNNHPDIHILGADEDARSIKIEEIRESIAAASLKPYEAKWKVFLIWEADRLTQDASNALLKTLEEAPPDTVFVLTTTHKANLLETIQSRAFELRLKPLEVPSPLPLGFAHDIKGKAWEDVLEGGAGSRESIQQLFDHLMIYFRDSLEKAVSPDAEEAYLEAIELLTECKEAIESNANQKLVLSRLAMQLRRMVPTK